VKINAQQAVLDDQFLSDRTTQSLNLRGLNYIKVRLGIKPDAQNIGGINLFGKKFGNHPQDILMRIRYRFEDDARQYKLQ